MTPDEVNDYPLTPDQRREFLEGLKIFDDLREQPLDIAAPIIVARLSKKIEELETLVKKIKFMGLSR